jgi:hypothetical protein
MRKPEIGYSAARLLVGRPTITKYFDQRQLGAGDEDQQIQDNKIF